MKKSKSIMLLIAPVLSTLLFNACGGSGGEAASSRDVYQSKEDCLKDWGDQELCESMNDEDDREYRSGGGVFIGRPFYGPRYYAGDRSVMYKGKAIAPTGTSTSLKPYSVTSRSSASSRSSSVSSPRSSSSSYGGFGGRSSGSSSGS